MDNLENEFRSCIKFLSAIGDESRQYLIGAMLETMDPIRVVELEERTNRPALPSPAGLKILRDAGVVRCKKEGICVYYYLASPQKDLENLKQMLSHALELTDYFEKRRDKHEQQ